jgi:hypothetical protein
MQKKYRFYVFGYRNQDFWAEFGPIVRDLMICESLSRFENVDAIHFFNRPKNILEIILGRKKIHSSKIDNDKLVFHNSFSLDVFGVLKKRLWNKKIYVNHYENIELSPGFINVVIDFLPIGELPSWVEGSDLIWYDYIDNFSKHNRYSDKEKSEVLTKYAALSARADMLFTGVSKGLFSINENLNLIPNAVLNPEQLVTTQKIERSSLFDFGFMGFITDKFDIDLINSISSKGYSVAIHGECYDPIVENKIKAIPNVTFFGRFYSSQVVEILSSFKCGMIPYKKDMLHDESPLKLYQYLCASKCVISSYHFDFSHQLFFVYDENNKEEVIDRAKNFDCDQYILTAEEVQLFSWEGRLKIIFNLMKSKLILGC